MKISNSSVKHLFLSVYIFIGALLLINIIDDNISGSIGNSINNSYLMIILGLFIVILFWRGLPLFQFDSEGEVLIFSASEPLIISRFSDVKLLVEFPKRKLESFRVKRLPLKRVLYLNIKSSNKSKTLKFNISYLRKNELKLLVRSLNKVLKNNKKELLDERSTGRELAFG